MILSVGSENCSTVPIYFENILVRKDQRRNIQASKFVICYTIPRIMLRPVIDIKVSDNRLYSFYN